MRCAFAVSLTAEFPRYTAKWKTSTMQWMMQSADVVARKGRSYNCDGFHMAWQMLSGNRWGWGGGSKLLASFEIKSWESY